MFRATLPQLAPMWIDVLKSAEYLYSSKGAIPSLTDRVSLWRGAEGLAEYA